MGDAIKWGLLVAGIVVIIGLILALPFVQFINVNQFAKNIGTFTSVLSGYLYNARCLLNNFLSSTGRTMLSGLLIWLIGKPIIKVSLNTVVWVYHFIFK